MLPLPITIVAVVVFSVVTTAALERWGRGRLALSGVEYLVVGALAGPFVGGLLDVQVMARLDPIVSVVLGLAGFSLGVQLRTHVRRLDVLQVGILAALLTAGAVAAAVYGLLSTAYAPPALFRERVWLALELGAAAPAASAMAIDLVVAKTASAGPVTELVRGLGASGNFVAVAIAGSALAARRAGIEAHRLAMPEPSWVAVTLALGVACGLLFRIFLGRSTTDEDRTFLATSGVIILTSGLAAAVGISPLCTCALAGLTVSVTSPVAAQLGHVMDRLERPTMAMLCIFAGALWRPVDGVLWLLPPAYLAARLLASRASARVSLMTRPGLAPVVNVGSAVLAQGGVAAAIAINHAQVYPAEAGVVLATVLMPMVAIDALAPARLRRFLSNAGESGRVGDGPGDSSTSAGAPPERDPA